MRMLTSDIPGICRIDLGQILGAEQGTLFRQLIRDALARSPKDVALDCSLLNYIDSTGLGLLTLARTEAQRMGCTMRLVNLKQGHPRRVIELVRFDQLFPIEYA